MVLAVTAVQNGPGSVLVSWTGATGSDNMYYTTQTANPRTWILLKSAITAGAGSATVYGLKPGSYTFGLGEGSVAPSTTTAPTASATALTVTLKFGTTFFYSP